MSFWNTSDGEAIETTGSYEVSTEMEPIPNGSVLKAIATKAEWAESEGDRYINIRWDVVDGDYKSRVIFHKIRVLDSDAKKKDKALRMLAAIDANAGGKLMQLQGEPTDVDLAGLCNKPMEIRVRIWEMNDKTGNWVEAVSAIGNQKAQAEASSGVKTDDDVGW